ncbi:MAG: lysophospholipid acyltransferase family protein [Myxococcales bacterium]
MAEISAQAPDRSAKDPDRRPLSGPPFEVLRPFERFAFRLMRFFNVGRGVRASMAWQWVVLTWLFGMFVHRRIVVRGWDRLQSIPEKASIMMVTNHRTFFDQFIIGWLLFLSPRHHRKSSFPVRANFFYEHPAGLLITLLLSGGSMFPPFFRRPEAKAFNKYSLGILTDLLRQPGNLIGFHPEGTRNKGPDPYHLLPAQPGAGEVALKARPIIVPAFITGLTNDLLSELWANIRGKRPIVIVFGNPVDVSDWPAETRLSHAKKCADFLNGKIAALMEEEKAVRASAAFRPEGRPGR